MNSAEFQATARRLAQGQTEGDWRSAVSRSYYAVFHTFFEFFTGRGLNLGQGAQAHNNVYVGLNNCGIPAIQALASRVDRLRDQRVKADYDLRLTVLQPQAHTAVALADAVMSDFQLALATVRAQDVVDGARAHLRAIGRVP